MKLRTIMLITILHFIAAIAMSLYTFSAGMNRFDTNEEATITEKSAKAISTVLLYPIFLPMVSLMKTTGPKVFPGMLGYIPMFANSMVWGVSISFLVGVAKRNKKRPNQAL